MTICKQCGKETTNPKFCNRSCSAEWTNTHYTKRKKRRVFCEVCGVEITDLGKHSYSRRFCDKHHPQNRDWDAITIGEIRNRYGYQKHSRIRSQAQTVYKQSGKPKVCNVCGYSTHVEICHIQPIESFSDDTPISVVNCIGNLVALCRNHHWELDHNLMTQDDKDKIKPV